MDESGKPKWEKTFENYYPYLIGEGGKGNLTCEFKRTKKDDPLAGEWRCELGDKKFKAETIRLGTVRPIMASSLFVDKFGDLAMGGLSGSRVVCRARYPDENNEYEEVMCILSGV